MTGMIVVAHVLAATPPRRGRSRRPPVLLVLALALALVGAVGWFGFVAGAVWHERSIAAGASAVVCHQNGSPEQ